MWGMPDEDAYWERRREEWENPPKHPWDEAPEMVKKSLYLDFELDEIEAKYGVGIQQLDEEELLEIVEKFLGIQAEEACWNDSFGCVEYKYYEEDIA